MCREFTLLCKKLDLFGAELIPIDEKIEEYLKGCDENDEEESSVRKIGKERFRYNSGTDCYICPAGEELTYRFDWG